LSESTNEDREKARRIELCRRAESNPALACTIGDHYRLGTGGFRLHPRRAFRWYARCALGGDPAGQTNLGVCYELGFGCRGSMERAFRWYWRAAQQGFAVAMNNVGLCYRFGRGVAPDAELAARWLQRAAKEGYARALHYLEQIPGGTKSRDPVPLEREIVNPEATSADDGMVAVRDGTGKRGRAFIATVPGDPRDVGNSRRGAAPIWPRK
jgi:TPR repeat protein